ncbi:MAG: hypothetical protein ACC700_17160 [Anaerolineales bacterium]
MNIKLNVEPRLPSPVAYEWVDTETPSPLHYVANGDCDRRRAVVIAKCPTERDDDRRQPIAIF